MSKKSRIDTAVSHIRWSLETYGKCLSRWPYEWLREEGVLP